MKYLLKIMIVLALFCTLAIGQISNPAPVSFKIVNRDPSVIDGLILSVPWYTMYGDIRGDATLSATPDISPDSMEILTNYHERYWSIKITSWETPDLELELREFGYGAARGKFKDTFTLTNLGGGQFWTDSLFKSVAGHTFDWSVCFNDTSLINVNDEFRFYFWKSRLPVGSDLAALATYSLPSTDTTTIATWDTLGTPIDTFFTDAITGAYGYVSLFIDQWSQTAADTARFGVGLQVKISDGSWSFPLGVDQALLEIMVDSVCVDSGVVSERFNNIPADSTRFAFWALTNDNVVFRKIRALWRD